MCLLIHVVLPSDGNVTQKETEKELQYESLTIEIQQLWDMKRFVIAVISGVTGIATKTENIWKQYQESIQQTLCKKKKKTAVQGTSHVIRKV
jgi:nicotinate-nucleotide pyrophosphorylase